MCQRAVLLSLLLAACAAPPPRSPPHAPEKHAFVVSYREAANAFAIVDQISNWFPEKLEPEYLAAWKARFGEPRLDGWVEVRKRNWHPGPEDESVLIGRAKLPDSLALAFYGEDKLDAALAKAETLIGAADTAVLRATFAQLRPQLDELLVESRAFGAIVPKLAAELDDPRASAFVDELTRFYRVGAIPQFKVEFVWFPPVDSSGASVVGDTLLLRYNPTKQLDDATESADIALHEVTHFVSMHQSEEQKRALSKAFLAKCTKPPPDMQLARLFEEPMAVVHQKMFLAQNAPQRFDRERPWYGDPYASVSAKMIYDSVAQAHAEHRVLDERIAFAAGRSCRELAAISAARR